MEARYCLDKRNPTQKTVTATRPGVSSVAEFSSHQRSCDFSSGQLELDCSSSVSLEHCSSAIKAGICDVKIEWVQKFIGKNTSIIIVTF